MLIQTIESEVGVTFSTCSSTKVSYLEVCSYLVRQGASRIKVEYNTEEVIKGIYTLLTDEAYINIVKNDLLSLAYKSWKVFSESKSSLHGLLNVLGDRSLREDRIKLEKWLHKSGIIPKSTFEKELRGVGRIGNSKRYCRLGLSPNYGARQQRSVDNALEVNLATTLFKYLITNCKYKIYHLLTDDNLWLQVGPVDNIFIYKVTLLVFELQDTKVIINIQVNYPREDEPQLTCILFHFNIPNLIESLGNKVNLPVIENTTQENIYLRPDKYRDKVFPLDSFRRKSRGTLLWETW
jgi:hypothetical protein